jgi:hypothetical protein
MEVAPSLDASPFLVGGKAERDLMLFRSVAVGTSSPSCSCLVRMVVCVSLLDCTPDVFLFNVMKHKSFCVFSKKHADYIGLD